MLLTVRGDESLGSWSLKTSHNSSSRCHSKDESSKEEGLEVSSGEETHENRYRDTSHSSSSNCKFCESFGHMYLEKNHSTSSRRGFVDVGQV